MTKKITRREAIKDMFFVGVGLASAGTLLQACGTRGGAGKNPADLVFTPMPEAPEGSKIDSRRWDSLGETLGMLGLGCMRLPTLPGANGGHGGRLDQDAVNDMIDYAIAHGVNYFDTAPAYGESEVVTGNALKRHPRESFMIATKMSNMAWGNSAPTLEGAKTMFETSLRNLQVDYVDFLLLHAVSSTSEFALRFENNGVMNYILEQKAAGKIRHLGFSFHGSNADLPPLLDKYAWDFVQIQLNYADWKDMPSGFGPSDGDNPTSSEALYNILVERGIPVLVMEPVKGGALANVSDALRAKMLERHPNLSPAGNALTFVGSLPGVMVTLSGMSNMEQLKENVALFTGFKPFDQKEMDYMLTIADLYKSNTHIPCTACSYCMPCPNGVNIPGNFKVFNTASDNLSIPDPAHQDKEYKQKRKAFLKAFNELGDGAKATACIDCNACLPKCPQRIRIPQQLHMISGLVESLG
ncbi:MAG: aldo/keto reductase [Bacteroidales bacterium]|nr:aldo/keto reductase [Bacteroidales bacterium]